MTISFARQPKQLWSWCNTLGGNTIQPTPFLCATSLWTFSYGQHLTAFQSVISLLWTSYNPVLWLSYDQCDSDHRVCRNSQTKIKILLDLYWFYMNSIFNNYCARATLIDLQITNHNARPAFTTLASLVYPASRATKVNTRDISRMFQKKQCRTLVAVAYAFRHDVSSIDACCSLMLLSRMVHNQLRHIVHPMHHF